VGITEPGAGSDVAGIRTTARREGGDWVLNGTKMFITNGVHADLYFIAAKSGPGKRDISMFIVEKGTPGFSVGRALKKTGWLSSDTAELILDNVRIPAGNLLGEEGKGFYSVMKNFQTERIALAAMAVGPLPASAQAHAGLRAAAPGLRRRAVEPADHPPADFHAGCQDPCRSAIHVSLCMACDAGPRHRAGCVDVEGAHRRARQ
jgi:alkylation response protein AidB-like acyl-CoA dehydrogenase